MDIKIKILPSKLEIVNAINVMIMEIAKKEGYKPMQEVGADYVKDGTLSFEEYQRTLFVG